MFFADRDNDTICAISTPPGIGGISIVRISGNRAVEIVNQIASFVPKNPESHRVFYGTLKSAINDENLIDEVLISFFQEGRSFSGEKTIEISCHGNPIICERILKSLIILGARIADPGEFTYRAFMNGRLDLVQAESVLTLIEGQSKKATEIALKQLKGGVSKELQGIEDNLIWLMANLEASIDFSAEDIEILESSLILEKLLLINKSLINLLDSYNTGKKILSGYQVIFAGAPNVGKSSLLNNLLKEERAIVSNIPGTTRDVINDQIILDGVQVTFSDTAGLRKTDDFIESIGVSKSVDLIQNSDLIFVIMDSEKINFDLISDYFVDQLFKAVFIFNKADLISKDKQNEISNIFRCTYPSLEFYFVSALDWNCGDKIKAIVKRILMPQNQGHSALLSQARHFECLSKASVCINRAIGLVKDSGGIEYITLELKDALMRIQETLGKRYDDEVLDRIFKEFCIGK
jgi:tRNA modification GTPase